MKWKIDKLEKGARPTLLEAEKGNELIDRLNALGNMTVKTGTKNEVLYAGDSLVFTVKFPPDGFQLKEVEICENGTAEKYLFLVKSAV